MPIDYHKSKIYKITCINKPEGENEFIYIGSTTKDHISARLAEHVRGYRKYLNGNYQNVSVFQLFEFYGLDNIDIYLIKNYPCENKNQLHAEEGKEIKNHNNCINKRIAGRNKEDYRIDNKEKIKEKN